MDQKYRILVVGAGSIGERHIRCFLETGRAVIGVCEPAEHTRERIKQTYAVEGSFSDLDHALNEQWDTAVVATPADTHIDIAKQLAALGIAPLIEKPLALHMDGIADLALLLARRKLPCGVAYVHRAHPCLQEMRQAINSGRFGKPLQVVVNVGHHFPTYRPAYADIYYARRESGGGAVQDALPHVINAAEWLVGPVTRVVADMAHLKLPRVQVEDTVHVIARHAAVLASYNLNQHQAPNELSLTVVCENGLARYELPSNTWRWMTEPDSAWQQNKAAFTSRDDWYIAQAEAWISVLDGAAEPLCTLAEGCQTIGATLAVLDSATKQDGWINVPDHRALTDM
jgi:predicted dehydrogenase